MHFAHLERRSGVCGEHSCECPSSAVLLRGDEPPQEVMSVAVATAGLTLGREAYDGVHLSRAIDVPGEDRSERECARPDPVGLVTRNACRKYARLEWGTLYRPPATQLPGDAQEIEFTRGGTLRSVLRAPRPWISVATPHVPLLSETTY